MKKPKNKSGKRQAELAKILEALESISEDVTTLQDAITVAIDEAVNKVLAGDLATGIRSKIEDAMAISELHDELEDTRSNMEERFSNTERYSRLEELVQTLSTAKDSIDGMELPEELDGVENVSGLLEKIDDISGAVAEAKGELENAELDYTNG